MDTLSFSLVGWIFNDSLWNGCADLLNGAFESLDFSKLTRFLLMSNKVYDGDVSLWGIVNSILAVTKPFGMSLIVVFFLMYIFDIASKDQATIDSVVKMMIQLVVVVGIVGNLDTILTTMINIGDAFVTKVQGSTSITDGNNLEICKQMLTKFCSESEDCKKDYGDTLNNFDDLANKKIGNTSFEKIITPGRILQMYWREYTDMSSIGGLLQGAVLWLLFKVANIALYFAAMQRALEIAWKSCFAPIAVSNSFDGGVNSAGIKYLKSFFATILSGALVLVIASIGVALATSLLIETEFWIACAALFATAGAAIGVSQKAKEIVI